VRVGVVDGGLREHRLVDRAHRLLDDLRAVVGGVDHGLRPVVHVDDEAVARAQHEEPAVGADADVALAVVGLVARHAPLARAVAVARVVVGVVVVLVEVPATDVVGVPVGVVVDAVREEGDEVARVEDAVLVLVADHARLRRRRRVRAGVANVGRVGRHGADPRIVRVVRDAEDAVAVAVVSGERAGAAARAAVRVLGLVLRQLRGVQVRLVGQIALVPLDATVDDRDPHVGAPDRVRPADVDVHPARAERLIRAEVRLRPSCLLGEPRPVVPVALVAGIVRPVVRVRHVGALGGRPVVGARLADGERQAPQGEGGGDGCNLANVHRNKLPVRRYHAARGTYPSAEPMQSRSGLAPPSPQRATRGRLSTRRRGPGCGTRGRWRSCRATRSTRSIRRARSGRAATR